MNRQIRHASVKHADQDPKRAKSSRRKSAQPPATSAIRLTPQVKKPSFHPHRFHPLRSHPVTSPRSAQQRSVSAPTPETSSDGTPAIKATLDSESSVSEFVASEGPTPQPGAIKFESSESLILDDLDVHGYMPQLEDSKIEAAGLLVHEKAIPYHDLATSEDVIEHDVKRPIVKEDKAAGPLLRSLSMPLQSMSPVIKISYLPGPEDSSQGYGPYNGGATKAAKRRSVASHLDLLPVSPSFGSMLKGSILQRASARHGGLTASPSVYKGAHAAPRQTHVSNPVWFGIGRYHGSMPAMSSLDTSDKRDLREAWSKPSPENVKYAMQRSSSLKLLRPMDPAGPNPALGGGNQTGAGSSPGPGLTSSTSMMSFNSIARSFRFLSKSRSKSANDSTDQVDTFGQDRGLHRRSTVQIGGNDPMYFSSPIRLNPRTAQRVLDSETPGPKAPSCAGLPMGWTKEHDRFIAYLATHAPLDRRGRPEKALGEFHTNGQIATLLRIKFDKFKCFPKIPEYAIEKRLDILELLDNNYFSVSYGAYAFEKWGEEI